MWLVAALFGGYTAANFLKWVWWRFNGYGYFWGMVAGLTASLTVPKILPDISVLNAFPIIFLIATTGSLLGCLLTRPESDEVLMKFYSTVRPWGYWGYVFRKVQEKDPDFKRNTAFKRDMFNCFIGITWQMTLVVMPIFLIIREYVPMLIAIALFGLCSFILKKNWYDRLEDN